MHTNRALEFVEFIYDRQLVWFNRFIRKTGKPWSTNPILNKYHFCNIYRELDKGTIHLIDNIINSGLSNKDKVFNIIAYRLFNVNGFFGEILQHPFNPDSFEEDFMDYEQQLDQAKFNGMKLQSEAYMFTGVTINPYRKQDKHIQTLHALGIIASQFNRLMADIMEFESLKKIHERLCELPCVGPFIAHQILVDMTYIEGLFWQDINSFVHVGPGAVGSLEYIYGSKDHECCFHLFLSQKNLFNMLFEGTGKQWRAVLYKTPYFKNQYLSISNIQNSLCEFRKYRNYSENKKRKRTRLYKGVEDGLFSK